MGISTELQYATLDDLFLDTKNPRFSRANADTILSQEDVLKLMKRWVLDELAVSYLESGFWTHEALLVVREELNEKQRLVVVEGNRRLAALKYLRRAVKGEEVPKKWRLLVGNRKVPEILFNKVPYILVDSREEIESFLGFRHVTGIKQWSPEQKAHFIAKLIDERGMSYEEVMQKIGSKTSTVRQHYISHRLILQMEDTLGDFADLKTEGRFSVMYLSLRTHGVRKYLDIDIFAEPAAAKTPVPKTRLEALGNFARWLFGTSEKPPIFADSRRVDDFGRILECPEAVEYLKENSEPNFDQAFRLAGGDESQIARLINEAANKVQLALSRAHHYTDSEDIQDAVRNLLIDNHQLLSIFPVIRKEFRDGQRED